MSHLLFSAKGGELFNYLTKEVTIPEKICRRMVWQLLQAVQHMHGNDIVHRDLKVLIVIYGALQKQSKLIEMI